MERGAAPIRNLRPVKKSYPHAPGPPGECDRATFFHETETRLRASFALTIGGQRLGWVNRTEEEKKKEIMPGKGGEPADTSAPPSSDALKKGNERYGR